MNDILKKSTLFSFALFVLSLSLCAQKNLFIYIQAENKQPFYIRIDKKILSSSVSGYIIISKLTDSTYNLFIGFPKKEWPEQNVTITVKETDAGFLLKNYAEKGWGLLNLQTMQVLMPEKKAVNIKAVETELTGDTFPSILALVVNDPTIAQRGAVKSENLPVEKSPETRLKEKPVIKEDIKSMSVDKGEITKVKYDVTTEGVNVIYLDIVNGTADTVKVFIPAVISAIAEEQTKQMGKKKLIQVKDKPKNKDSRFIDMELQNPNLKLDSSKITSNELSKTPEDSSRKEINGVMVNSGCKSFASREEFLNLRKQMTAIEGYDDMINAARKIFKDNCFTTEQIKNLGSLFLKDEGKYKFFNVAYPYVSDSNNFHALENQLTDKYFITKFKAMLRH